MSMVTVKGWENRKGSDYIADGDRLVPVTDEAIAEVARDAMLLAQGYERAAEMLGEELSDDAAPDRRVVAHQD
jgi:hypothetical protein